MSSGCWKASRFLTARIQLKMEAEFPTFTQSLLQMVYPHYLAPTPSMAVVQFSPDDALARHAARASCCRAAPNCAACSAPRTRPTASSAPRTPVQLLPIELAEAEYIASPAAVAALGLPEQRGVKAAIRLRLTHHRRDADRQARAREACRSSSAAPRARACGSTSSSSANVAAIYVRPATRPLPWQDRLPAGALRALGFAPEEALLPRAAAILRRLPAAAGILRDAGALPVRRTRRARPRRRAAAPGGSWRSSCC